MTPQTPSLPPVLDPFAPAPAAERRPAGDWQSVGSNLQRTLLRAATNSDSSAAFLSTVEGAAREAIRPLLITYFCRDESKKLTPGWQSGADEGPTPPDTQTALLNAVCDEACLKGVVQVKDFAASHGAVVVAAPVFLHNQPPEALAAVLPTGDRRVDRAVMTLELIASHLTMRQLLREKGQSEQEAETAAALLDIFTRTDQCQSLAEAGYVITNDLKKFFACDQVAIGLQQEGASSCSLIGLSGHAKHDRNSELVRGITAALDEACLRNETVPWRSVEESCGSETRALSTTAKRSGHSAAISGPLKDRAGKVIGAWLFLNGDGFSPEAVQLVDASSGPTGSFLRLAQQRHAGVLAKARQRLVPALRSAGLKYMAAGALVLAAVLCSPWPYRIACDCRLQPTVRRYVTAPFDGRLEEAVAETGDLVQQGDLLARMEGRDLRSELAGIEADLQQALKRRDSALAGKDIVTAQIARLEVERLRQKKLVLERRFKHLEVTSPIAGIVIAGNQERSEGATLKLGQGLYEIAPLERMVVEIAVPEDEVNHIREGMPVTIRLDALDRESCKGEVRKLHLRSETIDDQNVFVAEVVIDNPEGLLRPGMSGNATITSDRHTLAWNWFHKPWRMLLWQLGH